VATGDGTHWDPGPGYPWDVVLAKANAYRNATSEEDDMTPGQAQLLEQIHQVLFSGSKENPQPLTTHWRLVDVQMALTNSLPVLLKGADVDETALAKALAPLMTAPLVAAVVEELRGIDGVDASDVEAAAERAVRRVLGDAAA
jgi:hypothetical protein